jgi:hypothetical protein
MNATVGRVGMLTSVLPGGSVSPSGPLLVFRLLFLALCLFRSPSLPLALSLFCTRSPFLSLYVSLSFNPPSLSHASHFLYLSVSLTLKLVPSFFRTTNLVGIWALSAHKGARV